MTLAHFQRTFTDRYGNVRGGLSVTVRRESDNALVALYSDAAGTVAKTNPFNTDVNGYGDFYVAGGRYRIQATGIDWRNLDLISEPDVTQALDKRTIYVGSVAEIEALSLPVGYNVYLTEEKRFGSFLVKSGTPPSDPLKGIYIVLANGNYAVRQYGQAVIAGAATKPEWFTAQGDGITVDAQAIYEAHRLRVSGGAVEFDGSSTYLIDDSAGTVDPVYGVIVCDTNGETNPRLIGNGCTIKVDNHDVSAGVGLRFANFEACNAPKVSGFNFEMTFTGVNTSSSFYPWCGAVTFFDEATGVKTQAQLNTDVVCEDCTFNLFHPFGTFATSGAPFSGDPNNGFKVFSAFASGDNLATAFDNQNNNCRFENLVFKKGHNAYGPWVWAYNNVRFNKPVAEDWVAKYSDNAGNFVGAVIPFIRYHQFYCKGVYVNDIYFRAKPCSERTTSGYEGAANAIGFNTSLNGAGLEGGDMVINGGTIIAGNGDAANSTGDTLIFCNCYGKLVIDGGLSISGISDTTNADSGSAIQYTSESSGGTGYGEVHIGDVSIDRNMDFYDNIQILNGASVAGDRRCKVLKISDVTSFGQFQYFLDTDGGSAETTKGVPLVKLGSIAIDGNGNSQFGPGSTNSRAFRFAGESGDIITGDDVSVDGKYYEFLTTNLNSGALFRFNNYRNSNTTTRMIGSTVPILSLIGSGTPEGVEVAAVGSTFQRSDGGVGTSFYVKESATPSTGWGGK